MQRILKICQYILLIISTIIIYQKIETIAFKYSKRLLLLQLLISFNTLMLVRKYLIRVQI